MNVLQSVVLILIMMAIWLGIPYFIGNWWHLTWSWIPSLIALYHIGNAMGLGDRI